MEKTEGQSRRPSSTLEPARSAPGDTEIILNSVRRIVRSLRQASKATEKQIGLSAAQLYVLQKIAESKKPLSINELAEKTLTHQSSVSVVVAKLVSQGLIERTVSASDGRSVQLRLHKKGKDLLHRGPPVIQNQLVDAVSRLSVSQRHALATGLQALIREAGLETEEATLFFEEGRE